MFVDFVRGAAALLVAYFHFQIGLWHFPLDPIAKSSFTYHFVSGDFELGVFGVGLFFIISGFLIPSTLRGASATIRRFALHRFFRLYPLYWLSIGGMILVAPVLGTSFTLVQVLANATMLQGYLRQGDVIGVYWTLQIELTFYFVCVLLFYFRKLEKTAAILCFFLAASLACAAARHELGRRLPVALFLGPALMFLGDMIRRSSQDATLRRRLPFYAGLVLALLVPICFLAYADLWQAYVRAYFAAIGSFFLAHRCAPAFETHARLRAFSIWLGETSYGAYLFHGITGGILLRYLLAHGVEEGAQRRAEPRVDPRLQHRGVPLRRATVHRPRAAAHFAIARAVGRDPRRARRLTVAGTLSRAPHAQGISS